ncbi:MAG: 4Fe-4S dicluster domain-containing protein [Thermoplasmata archaeon]|nr:MAG: 4Fe-4S dicluster domain-containing protein [Thermoplasmata archaeon]
MASADEPDPRWKRLDRTHMNYCIQCGRCTSACPLATQIDYSPRQKVNEERLLVDENLDEYGGSVWTCLACYNCNEACEQGVHAAAVVRVVRQRLFQLGMAPEGINKVAKEFSTSGMAFPVTGFTKKMRREMDLGDVPTTAADAKAMDEVRTLLVLARYPPLVEEEAED